MFKKDHLGHLVRVKDVQRIVSLVPSQTELLFDLGLENHIIAVTNFCVHPANKTKTILKVGGTKSPLINKIISLKPSIVLANKEENNLIDIQRLKQNNIPVWLSDVSTYADNERLISDFGILFNKEKQAEELISEIRESWLKNPVKKQKSCLYFIWRKPYMLTGKNTFIDAALAKAGFTNIILKPRYPELSVASFKQLSPELVFLSSEPYAFKEEHIKEFKRYFPNATIVVVDGELFSWFGSRQKYLPGYVAKLMNHL